MYENIPIIMIVATSAKGCVIGNSTGPAIPWPMLKGDMRRFKEITTPHPVIMGRKTYETLKRKGKQIVLPDRKNIVITRNLDYEVLPEALTAISLEEALKKAAELNPGHICIIGGAQIYNQALGYAENGTWDQERCIVDEIFLTTVHLAVEGDVCIREIPPCFRIVATEDHEETVGKGETEQVIKYSFIELMRRL